MDSGVLATLASQKEELRLVTAIEAQHRIALPELAAAVQSAKAFAWIKMLIVFGNHQASGSQQPRL